MNIVKKVFLHTRTILRHKRQVLKMCFKFGLYKQGIFHDISKFNPKEFLTSVKFYQGGRSPIEAEKEIKGYSIAWAHHHNKNPHHWLYWVDFNNVNEITPMKIPYKFALEAIADWIGAGMTYYKNAHKEWDWAEPYEYYKANTRVGSDKNIHPHTRQLWDMILVDIKTKDIKYVAKQVRKGYYKKIYNKPSLFKQQYDDILDKYYKE